MGHFEILPGAGGRPIATGMTEIIVRSPALESLGGDQRKPAGLHAGDEELRVRMIEIAEEVLACGCRLQFALGHHAFPV